MRGSPFGTPLHLTRGAVLLLAVLFAGAWFAPLGVHALLPGDESRYAEIAREMLAQGDWITPRYHDAPYLAEPPLQMWATAVAFALFGLGEWQARLWSALCGFGAVFFVGYTGVRLFGRPAGILTAAVLAATPYWHLLGHYASLDMGFSALLTVALCALLLAQRATADGGAGSMGLLGGFAGARPVGTVGAVAPVRSAAPPGGFNPLRGRRGWMWLFWIALALAVLSKGPIGLILPGMVLLIYSVIARDLAIWRRLYLVSGLILFLAVAAPWFVAVAWHHPGFVSQTFLRGPLRDYLDGGIHRPQPFYYLAPVCLIGFLPWLSLQWQSTRRALRLPRQTNRFSPAGLLVTWAATIFLFFSGSASKVIADALPIVPALALLVGVYLPTRDLHRIRRHLAGYAVLLITIALGVVYLSNFGSETTPNVLYRQFQAWLWLAVGVTLFGIAVAGVLARRLGARTWLVYAAAWYAGLAIAGNAHEIVGRPVAGVTLAHRVRAVLAQTPDGGIDRPFYAVGVHDDSLSFYLRRTLIPIAGGDSPAAPPGEPHNTASGLPGDVLDRADEQDDPDVSNAADRANGAIAHAPDPTALDAWKRRWRERGPAYALMTPTRYRALRAEQIPMTVIARDARRVVVAR
jgi:4-amino-4-deoxy-L-arabinose transferase-like glycosyltransferase